MKNKIKFFSIILLSIIAFSGCSDKNRDGVTSAEIKKNIGESQLSETKQMNEKVQENIQLMYDKKLQKETEKQQPKQPTNQQQMQKNNVPPPPPPPSQDLSYTQKYNRAVIHTSLGDIQVDFYNDKAPNTVNNFLKLADEKFYNDIRFHRVIPDFMIQAGDPNSRDVQNRDAWGTGGPGYAFADEINDEKLVKGSLAMANSGPNTNGSQFFIVTKDETPWLDGKHTNFGFVSEGMEVVDAIDSVETNEKDQPLEDVTILSIDLIEK